MRWKSREIFNFQIYFKKEFIFRIKRPIPPSGEINTRVRTKLTRLNICYVSLSLFLCWFMLLQQIFPLQTRWRKIKQKKMRSSNFSLFLLLTVVFFSCYFSIKSSLWNFCVCVGVWKNHADLRIAKRNASTFEELNRKSSLIRLERRRQIKDICLGKLLFIHFIQRIEYICYCYVNNEWVMTIIYFLWWNCLVMNEMRGRHSGLLWLLKIEIIWYYLF